MRHAHFPAVTSLLATAILGLLAERSAQAQVAQFIDSNGPANSDWSNINNWAHSRNDGNGREALACQASVRSVSSASVRPQRVAPSRRSDP